MNSLEKLILKAEDNKTVKELALGYLQYEALRKLGPRSFAELHRRNIEEEINFDEMVVRLITEGGFS